MNMEIKNMGLGIINAHFTVVHYVAGGVIIMTIVALFIDSLLKRLQVWSRKKMDAEMATRDFVQAVAGILKVGGNLILEGDITAHILFGMKIDLNEKLLRAILDYKLMQLPGLKQDRVDPGLTKWINLSFTMVAMLVLRLNMFNGSRIKTGPDFPSLEAVRMALRTVDIDAGDIMDDSSEFILVLSGVFNVIGCGLPNRGIPALDNVSEMLGISK